LRDDKYPDVAFGYLMLGHIDSLNHTEAVEGNWGESKGLVMASEFEKKR
jgi:hypothetical protein